MNTKTKLRFDIKSLFLILIATTILHFGCKKSELDLLPFQPTEADYFKTELDFSRAVYGTYGKMASLYTGAPNSGGSMPIFLLMGDDITLNDGGFGAYDGFDQMNASDGKVAELWATCYAIIGRANVVLEKIEGPEGSVYTTPNLKETHKGEALFLRGLGYYYLWSYFETAPLRNNRITSTADFFPANSTGTQLIDQALEDFKTAADLLPASWPSSDKGRATKNSANGFEGKLLVSKASFYKNVADYTTALTYLNKVTSLSLTSNFSDNFAYDTENNSESVFEYQSSQPLGGENVWVNPDEFTDIGAMSTYWGFYSPGATWMPRFLVTSKLATSFAPADPRRNQTLDISNSYVTKYILRDKKATGGAAEGSVNNYRLLRFADIKLLKAEALIQSGGSTTEALQLIEDVRARARNMVSGGTVPVNLGLTETNRTTIMNFIMAERYLEFAGEGQRWLDLVRWQKQGIITLNSAFFSSNNPVAFKERNLLLPIPTSELDVNKNMQQSLPWR